MLRSKMIRAAIPKGVPINFVDATSGTGGFGSTGTITVSTGDFVLGFSSGRFPAAVSSQTLGGTSSTSSVTDDTSAPSGGATSGYQSNEYLDVFGHFTITSGGTLNLTDTGGDSSAAYGLLAADGGDSLSFQNAGSGSISVSSVTTDDLVVIFEIAESFGSAPTLNAPSGYTSAMTYTYTAGKGGGATGARVRVSYQTGQSGTVSHTVTTAGDAANAAAIIRIYNA